MKKILAFMLGLSVVVSLGNVSAFAQKGPSPGQVKGRPEVRPEVRQQPVREAKAPKPTFADKMERNPRMTARVNEMLPPGTNLRTASAGFKNQGQFIAALHASRNLNIPFSQLKSRMTGNDAMSLGQAIQELRPDLSEKSAKEERKRAEKDAKNTK